jgi:hypothetical protein
LLVSPFVGGIITTLVLLQFLNFTKRCYVSQLMEYSHRMQVMLGPRMDVYHWQMVIILEKRKRVLVVQQTNRFRKSKFFTLS